ncbi:Oidioi.mRNA.OKI2018_I69.chr2.g5457.t1.cds [Oikopleura dioica]|uniref:Oidioi.mRNA.OKI2018_I69.chr2.g5457.t1.cds n=1 Tax=Oikopleura dioica TaxID=34765 RepID=A0ABN7T0X4_OIKDI|nr:Oidioi.mRNA.OKI2018_I69.chr2.g5457.t1.cds [Oikopleura dioica]
MSNERRTKGTLITICFGVFTVLLIGGFYFMKCFLRYKNNRERNRVLFLESQSSRIHHLSTVQTLSQGLNISHSIRIQPTTASTSFVENNRPLPNLQTAQNQCNEGHQEFSDLPSYEDAIKMPKNA